MLVIREDRAHLRVHAVGNDHEGVILEQFRNIACVTNSDLFKRIVNRGVRLDSRLVFPDDHRETVDINNGVGNALLLGTFDNDLIAYLQDVVLRMVEINHLKIEVLLRTVNTNIVFAFDNLAKNGPVGIVKR